MPIESHLLWLINKMLFIKYEKDQGWFTWAPALQKPIPGQATFSSFLRLQLQLLHDCTIFAFRINWAVTSFLVLTLWPNSMANFDNAFFKGEMFLSNLRWGCTFLLREPLSKKMRWLCPYLLFHFSVDFLWVQFHLPLKLFQSSICLLGLQPLNFSHTS